MPKTTEGRLSEALGMMAEARKILFQQLHNPEKLNQNLVKGVDKLGQAIEFAENPFEHIDMCPECGSLCCERLLGNQVRCLSCDIEWNRLDYFQER